MPYTTRVDGDVLTASSHNANCRDQVVSTVTSATRPAGTEGQLIYETDTHLLYIYNGGWIQFGGTGTWTTWTPTLTQSGVVTKTVTYARSMKFGRSVFVNMRLDVTGAGTANNPITVSLPHTAAAGSDVPIGSGWIVDASGSAAATGIVTLATTTTIHLLDTTQATTASLFIGQTGTIFAAALASGDVLGFSAIYESAA